MELYGHDDRQYSALKGTIPLTLQNYREKCESCLRAGVLFLMISYGARQHRKVVLNSYELE